MPIRVSIVEDDAETREIVGGWLNRAADFECASKHSTAESAIKHLAQHQPEVVLMDINLPGVNGVECVRQLKPSLPETQFVILTVYEDMEHIFNALQAGASGYLLKQTPRAELLDALRDVHKGGSPMTSSIARKVVRSFQQRPSSDPEVDDLSDREHEVLDLLARGFLYKEIADQLEIAVPTVNTYIRRIYEKLHVRSRAQAVAKYTHLPTDPSTT
jgi:DNA-binding NarL/FixJ family response regulator